MVDTAGLRRKAKVQDKLEKLSTSDSIRAITFAEVVLLVMDATHPFEIQDLQIADLVEREGRCLVFVLAKWDLVEDPAGQLKAFREHAERMLPQVRGAPVVALSAETGHGIGKLMPAILKTHNDWSTKVKTRDLNDWLAHGYPAPPAARRRRQAHQAQVHGADQGAPADVRAVLQPRRADARAVSPLSGEQPSRELRHARRADPRLAEEQQATPMPRAAAKSGAPSFQQGGEAKKEKAMSLAAEARAEKAAATAVAAGW